MLRTYRLYRLDWNGRINSADWVQADDDDDARLKARDEVPSGHYELWDRDRLIEASAQSG